MPAKGNILGLKFEGRVIPRGDGTEFEVSDCEIFNKTYRTGYLVPSKNRAYFSNVLNYDRLSKMKDKKGTKNKSKRSYSEYEITLVLREVGQASDSIENVGTTGKESSL